MKQPREMMIKIIAFELRELYQAAAEMVLSCPPGQLPRAKKFRISKSFVWPDERAGDYQFLTIRGPHGGIYMYDRKYDDEAWKIAMDCAWQPRLVRRAVMRIRAAVDWCRRQTSKRRKQ